MALNLIDSVKDFFTRDIISQTATELGENESNVQKAVSAAIPTSMVGMLNKAGSGGGSDLLDMAKRALSINIPGNLKRLFSSGSGMANLPSLAGGLFGDKLSNIVKSISGYAGIKESSASSIINLAAPTALATVGREASSPSGLVSMLNNQKESILNSVPSGLNLAGALGLGSLSDISSKIGNAVTGMFGSAKSTVQQASNYAGETVQAVKRKSTWVWPLILLAAILLGAWYFFGKGCAAGTMSSTEDTTTKKATAVINPPLESVMVKLPDGTELNAMKGGIEDKLVKFLGSNWQTLGDDELKNTWFDFDNLNFETGSANITPESMRQINNIVAIMKAFPAAKFKIGGYTDRVGDNTSNKQLSQQRADATADALRKAGADASRIVGAEGYGEDFATVDENESDTERMKDRRIAVSIRR